MKTVEIVLNRKVRVPDEMRVKRFGKAPELGPQILFFSGGSALASLSRRLIDFTHNSIHLITTFDSGGSSAALRKAFHMPAVGDLRNRLMSLADQSVRGNHDVFRFFAHRLTRDNPKKARTEFDALLNGADLLIAIIEDPLRKIIRNHLRLFAEAAPEDFDFSGASVGNLILTGGYLNNGRHLDPVIYLFSRLVEARGTVRPVVNRCAHLMAECDDGSRIVGQKEITARRAGSAVRAVQSVDIIESKESPVHVSIPIRKKTRNLICGADAIVYPMGSFFTSLLASMTPAGIGAAVAENGGSKIMIPNTGHDPESAGLSLNRQTAILIEHIRRTAPSGTPVKRLLDFVLVDSLYGGYQRPCDLGQIRSEGVQVIDTHLVTEKSAPYIDEELLIAVLLSLV